MTISNTPHIVERLKAQAQRASDIARQMAEDKSLRQEGHDPPRADLYMWPKPEQTIEGQAAAVITAYEAALDLLVLVVDVNHPEAVRAIANASIARQRHA